MRSHLSLSSSRLVIAGVALITLTLLSVGCPNARADCYRGMSPSSMEQSSVARSDAAIEHQFWNDDDCAYQFNMQPYQFNMQPYPFGAPMQFPNYGYGYGQAFPYAGWPY